MKNRYTKSQTDFLYKLGKNIRKARKEKNISQESFAETAELDRTYVGSVERGERNISILNIKKIAESLNKSISELTDI